MTPHTTPHEQEQVGPTRNAPVADYTGLEDGIAAWNNRKLPVVVDSDDLYLLGVAANEWLRYHPDDPNAPAIREALENTVAP